MTEEEKNMRERAQECDASQIQVLEGLETVRKRSGIYIGSTSGEELYHLVWEIVDNSIGEALAGFTKSIQVIIEPDDSIIVIDNGCGVPVGIQAKTGRPAVETVFTVLRAGGKFGDGSYKISGGLHGVGSSVVNALSISLDVRVYKDGKVYYREYHRGAAVDDLRVIEETDRHGITTYFIPNPEIFTETTIYDSDRLVARVRELIFLGRDLRISIEDRHEGQGDKKEYHYEGGIKSYVEHLNTNKDVTFPEPIFIEGEQQGIAVEVSMQYAGGCHSNTSSFADNIHTYEGGTHESGSKTSLTRIINDYAREQKLMKENDGRLIGEDIREGLTAVVSIRHPDPQFEGQTKTKLGNSEVRTVTDRLFSGYFTKSLVENPTVDKQIAKRGMLTSKAHLAAKRAREVTRREGASRISNPPEELTDCSGEDSEKCELLIVEGDPAGGSAKQGRSREFQAILPIHGGILNVEKVNMDKVLTSEEIRSLFTAIGTDFGEDFDVFRARYHKLVTMTDAGVDGAHIQTLLLTLFYRFIRPIVEAGYVYIAQPPLYGVKQGKGVTYVQPDKHAGEELAKVLEGLPASSKPSVQRYKGLGEMDDHQPWETIMDPEERLVARASAGDTIGADQIFEMLMGNRVEPRRAFIEKNTHCVKNLDI